jgi:hypothetical protein
LKENGGNIKIMMRKHKYLCFLAKVLDSKYATNKHVRESVSGAIHTLEGTLIHWISKMQESTATWIKL